MASQESDIREAMVALHLSDPPRHSRLLLTARTFVSAKSRPLPLPPSSINPAQPLIVQRCKALVLSVHNLVHLVMLLV